MKGKSCDLLTPGVAGSKSRRAWLWRIVIFASGVGVVNLTIGGPQWQAVCVGLGMMMQLVMLLPYRVCWGYGLLLCIGVAGGLWPGFVRLGDQLLLYALALLGPFMMFVRSLRRGQTAFITQLAEAVHGPLRQDIRRYTIILTWVWSGFFMIALGAPVILWLYAPQQGWWHIPIRGGTLGVALLLFCGEMPLRRVIIRHYQHATLKQNIMASRVVFMRKNSLF
ncbi:hypothetical protein BG621_03055 [Parasaccharibacter apium]|nr:hypothetical protein BG621_03055 [Parasaccharibacter apium]